MARITVEDCLEMIPNRFTLVLVGVERTKQLMKGAKPLVDDERGNKEIVTALREIAAVGIMPEFTRFDENENVAIQRINRDATPGVDDLLPLSVDELPPEA